VCFTSALTVFSLAGWGAGDVPATWPLACRGVALRSSRASIAMVRKKVSGRTRAEVAEKLRKLHKQVDSGVVPDDRLTVRAFLDRWLTVNLPGSVAESTEDDYVDTVRLHLVPALGRKPLAKLAVADLDRLWKAKRDAGYSSNSVRIMRTVLRRALGQAVREGIVARNVAGLSAAPRIRAKDGRTLTLDQARQLLEAAAGYRFEAAVVLVVRAGGPGSLASARAATLGGPRQFGPGHAAARGLRGARACQHRHH
jgi:hypothetical protein